MIFGDSFHSKHNVKDYDIISVLGKGGFGNVFEAKDKTGNTFALKKVKFSFLKV